MPGSIAEPCDRGGCVTLISDTGSGRLWSGYWQGSGDCCRNERFWTERARALHALVGGSVFARPIGRGARRAELGLTTAAHDLGRCGKGGANRPSTGVMGGTDDTQGERIIGTRRIKRKVPPMRTITRQQLKAKLDAGEDIKLVMTVGGWAFRARHIPGSLGFPSPRCALRELRCDDEIIVYSTNHYRQDP